jgi:hypothetical protein
VEGIQLEVGGAALERGQHPLWITNHNRDRSPSHYVTSVCVCMCVCVCVCVCECVCVCVCGVYYVSRIPFPFGTVVVRMCPEIAERFEMSARSLLSSYAAQCRVSELILGGKETRRLIGVVKVRLSLECSIIAVRNMKRLTDLLRPVHTNCCCRNGS